MTFAFGGQRSIQLSYGCGRLFRSRTPSARQGGETAAGSPIRSDDYRPFFELDRFAPDFEPRFPLDFVTEPFTRDFDAGLPALFVPPFEVPELDPAARFEAAAFDPPDFDPPDFEPVLLELPDFALPDVVAGFVAAPPLFFAAPFEAPPLAPFVPALAPPRAALVFVAPRAPPFEAPEVRRTALPRFEADAPRPPPARFEPDDRDTNLKKRLVPPDPTWS